MPSAVAKSLSRLSREKLIDLCSSWSKSTLCSPYLASNRNVIETEEEDYLHEPAQSRKELDNIYSSLKGTKPVGNLQSLSKKDIIDRIVDGDWRRGLSYHQLAAVDFANLEENDTSLRWSALRLVPLSAEEQGSSKCGRPAKRRKMDTETRTQLPKYPTTSATRFVQNLKAHISPLVKAHYHTHRISALNLTVVRLYIQPNVPFAPLSSNLPRQDRSATDSSRTMYIALPDSCPSVYVSISGSTGVRMKDTSKTSFKVDIAATKKVVLEAIPKALSRPQQRWSLEPTKVFVRGLRSACFLRGGGRVGMTGGAFATLTTKSLPEVSSSCGDRNEQDPSSERQQEVEAKFGPVSGPEHARLDRVYVKIPNLFEARHPKNKKRKRVKEDSLEDEPMPVGINFSGSDVFAGLKELALQHPEWVNLGKLPSLLTGEAGTTMITI